MEKVKASLETPLLIVELQVEVEVKLVKTTKDGIVGAETPRLPNLEVEAPTSSKEEDTQTGRMIPHGAAPHLRTTPGRQRAIAPARLPIDAWMTQTPSLPPAPIVCAFLAPSQIAVLLQ